MSDEYTRGYRDGVMKTLDLLRREGAITEEDVKRCMSTLLRVRRIKGKKAKRKPAIALRKGRSYFVNEKTPWLGVRIFSDAVRHQPGGLCVMRIKYLNQVDDLGLNDLEDVEIIWLTQSESVSSSGMGGLLLGAKSIPKGNRVPLNDRAMILTKIKDRIKNADKRVIYFEGLDAMKFGARFDDIMKFLQQITETVSLYKAVAIFSIDLERLTEQERAAIEGELERIEIGHQNLRSS